MAALLTSWISATTRSSWISRYVTEPFVAAEPDQLRIIMNARMHVHSNARPPAPFAWLRRSVAVLALAAPLLIAAEVSVGSASGGDAEASISEVQQSQIRTLLKQLDGQVEAGFKGEDALRDKMTGELKALLSLKDDAARAKAIKAYQTRYLNDYRGVLKRAGIDLRAVVQRMRAIQPQFVFKLTPEQTVVGILSLDPPAPTPVPTPVPTATPTGVSTLTSGDATVTSGGSVDDFLDFSDRARRCSPDRRFGDIVFAAQSIVTTALTGAAQSCSNAGMKLHAVTLDTDRTAARVSLQGDNAVRVFAADPTRSASITAFSNLSVQCDQSRGLSGVGISVLALPLWPVIDRAARVDNRVEINVPAGVARCTTLALASVSAISANDGFGASGAAQVDRLRGRVEIDR
jgi:hypothetical protein